MSGVTGYPNEPPGLIVAGPLSARFLAFDPDYVDAPGSPWANAQRTMGWYYGYPLCCVDAFIARDDALRAAHGAWLDRRSPGDPIEGTADDPRPEYERRPGHPISGHLLCPACEAGPTAPFPARPAESYGFFRGIDDDEPYIIKPSGREPLEHDKQPVAPVFEQLVLEVPAP